MTLTEPINGITGREAYSAGLIAAARTLPDLDVVVHVAATDREQRRNRSLKLRSAFSRFPAMSSASLTPLGRRRVLDALARGWDAVVVDHLQLGWVAGPARRLGIPVVYIAHNHESSARLPMPDDQGLLEGALRLDRMKVRRLERRLLRDASLVTAITELDARRLESDGASRVALVSPSPPRSLSPRRDLGESPRKVLHFGSFDWSGKRRNLRELADEAAGPFARAGITLVVAGPGNPRRLFGPGGPPDGVDLVGEVSDDRLASLFADCRAAVVAEPRGGGFKMKVLDLMTARLPMYVLAGSVEGVDLRDGVNCRSFSSLPELVRACVAEIDDISLLDRLQVAAVQELDRFSLDGARSQLESSLVPMVVASARREVERV